MATAVVDLIGFFASPQRVDLLLREAGVEIDRALFPLLVTLARRGDMAVAALAETVGRDATTVSRQLTALERRGLITRDAGEADRRVRTVTLTTEGRALADLLSATRERLLRTALTDWSDADVGALADLNRRFADSLAKAAGASSRLEA